MKKKILASSAKRMNERYFEEWKRSITYKRKRRRPRTKPWETPYTPVSLEETWPLLWSKRENPGNEIVDFFNAAVNLRHKALWTVQEAKQQKKRRRTLDIQESDLQLALFHNLADISEIDGLLVVKTEEETFSQLIKYFTNHSRVWKFFRTKSS